MYFWQITLHNQRVGIGVVYKIHPMSWTFCQCSSLISRNFRYNRNTNHCGPLHMLARILPCSWYLLKLQHVTHSCIFLDTGIVIHKLAILMPTSRGLLLLVDSLEIFSSTYRNVWNQCYVDFWMVCHLWHLFTKTEVFPGKCLWQLGHVCWLTMVHQLS